MLKSGINSESAKLKKEPTMVKGLLWKSKGVVNTGFSTDVDTRSRITGYSIYFYDTLIAFKSRLQENVVLSITEGEYKGLF